MAGPGRPGRAPKGDRIALSLRIERDHREIYAAEAARLGAPLADYVALQLAHAHGLPVPAYLRYLVDDDMPQQLKMGEDARKSA